MIDGIKPIAPSPLGTAELDMTPVKPGAAVAGAKESDFGTLLGGLFMSAADAVKAAEATSISGIKGKASVQQVVEAVMNAEQSLQSAIAVRDKVVTAYLEISRMQI